MVSQDFRKFFTSKHNLVRFFVLILAGIIFTLAIIQLMTILNVSYFGSYPSTHPQEGWLPINPNSNVLESTLPSWLTISTLEIIQEEGMLFVHILWNDTLPSTISSIIGVSNASNSRIDRDRSTKGSGSGEYGYISRGITLTFQLTEGAREETVEIIQVNWEGNTDPIWDSVPQPVHENPWTIVYLNMTPTEAWFGFGRLGLRWNSSFDLLHLQKSAQVEVTSYITSTWTRVLPSFFGFQASNDAFRIDGNFSDWQSLGLDTDANVTLLVGEKSSDGFFFNSFSMVRSKLSQTTSIFIDITPNLSQTFEKILENVTLESFIQAQIHSLLGLEVYLANETHVSYSVNMFERNYDLLKELVLRVLKGKTGGFPSLDLEYSLSPALGAISQGIELALPSDRAPLLYASSVDEVESIHLGLHIVFFFSYSLT
ncbi:MAG: hypothetical protein ACFFDI_08365 [Promethearchaeota archaeon]